MNVCDLVRLCVPLQVPPPAVCALEPCETRNGAPILVGDQPRHITLRKDASGFCSLLIKGFGFVRCGVHALRPAICRIYPFSFERGATRYQMGMIGCPTLWLVDEPRRNAVLDDVESHEHDRVLDRKVVRRWNRLPREERTEAWFWVWALAQAGAEMGVDVSPFLEPKPRSRLKPALW
jgi:Fe-S-cluster containining protein